MLPTTKPNQRDAAQGPLNSSRFDVWAGLSSLSDENLCRQITTAENKLAALRNELAARRGLDCN